MNNRQIALKLMLDNLEVDDNIDTTDDRKRVQKAIYLGQIAGVDLGYRFSWYRMGPYSADLTRDYYAMAEELSAGADEWTGKSLKAPLAAKLVHVAAQLKAPVGWDVPSWLELIASYHYLRCISRKTHEEAVAVFQREKPKLAHHLDLARTRYEQLIGTPPH